MQELQLKIFWNIYCDNYIEVAKTRAYDENSIDPKGQVSALLTMYYAMKTLLKLFAPFIPHVTEEIYSNIYHDILVAQRGSWPKAIEFIEDHEAEEIGDGFVNILDSIRKIKADKQISVSFPIDELSIFPGKSQLDMISIFDDLANVTKSAKISINDISNMIYTEGELFKVYVKLK